MRDNQNNYMFHASCLLERRFREGLNILLDPAYEML